MSLDLVALGHALVDIRVLVERFPQPDEEAVILDERRGVGGSAANTAIAARRLGLRTGIIAKIGLDSFGRIVVDELLREGVDVSGLKVSLTSSTGFSIVVRDSLGQILVYGFKGAAEELTPQDVDFNLIVSARALHIASLRIDTSKEAACRARSNNVLVSWDPGRVVARLGVEKLKDLLKCVDIVLVNKLEAKTLTGLGDYRLAARKLLDYGPRIVIVKRGSEGAYMVSSEGVFEEPAYPVERVVDTTGAGDTFAAGFITALLWGWRLNEALRLASLAAALKVSKLGSHAAPTLHEVREYTRKLEIKLPLTNNV